MQCPLLDYSQKSGIYLEDLDCHEELIQIQYPATDQTLLDTVNSSVYNNCIIRAISNDCVLIIKYSHHTLYSRNIIKTSQLKDDTAVNYQSYDCYTKLAMETTVKRGVKTRQHHHSAGDALTMLKLWRAGGQEGRRAGGQEGRRAGGQEGRRAGGQEGRAGGQEGSRAGGQEGRRAGGQKFKR